MSSMNLGNLLDTVRVRYQNVSTNLTWSTVILYGGILGTTWVVYKAFLEPFLSPLRKMPGMRFSPFFGNMRELMRGEAMEATIKMMKQYGGICRYYFMFGRERIMIADPDIMKHILVTHSKKYIKPPSRMHLMRMILGNGLVMIEGSVHAAHKRLLSPSFNNNSIKNMVSVFVKRGQRLTEHWLKQVNAKSEGKKEAVEIQVQEDFSKTTLDIVGELGFGHDFNSLENHELAVNLAFQRILTGAGLSWRMGIPYYHLLPMPDIQRFKKDIALMQNAVDDVINNKRRLLATGAEEKEITGDVLGQMLLARDENGEGLTDEELRGEVMTIMLAGHETTAVGMSWCMLLLAQNPTLQERARQEVLHVLPENNNDITWDHVEQLEFCSCIIKETLRLCPPVPMTLRQSLEDDYLGGQTTPRYFVPKGTIMLLSAGPMMRREDLFESPNEFIPERFLDSQTDGNFYNYLPFLIGPRMCLGYKFALIEMRILLALLLRNLQFDTVPDVHFKRQSRITMRPNPPLRLRVQKV